MSDKEIKQVFDLYAKKKKVAGSDVGNVVRGLGFCPGEGDLQKIMAANGASEEADVKQVTAIVKAVSNSRKSGSEVAAMLKVALKEFDRDDADVFTVSEMSHMLLTSGDKMAKEQVDEILRQAEVDGFGQININNFASMMAAAVEMRNV